MEGTQAALEHATPEHRRRMLQDEHARSNLGGFRARHPEVDIKEMALYEGLRQALMAGEITGDELNALAKAGKLPPDVITLVTDIHDWGRHKPYPFEPEVTASLPSAG